MNGCRNHFLFLEYQLRLLWSPVSPVTGRQPKPRLLRAALRFVTVSKKKNKISHAAVLITINANMLRVHWRIPLFRTCWAQISRAHLIPACIPPHAHMSIPEHLTKKVERYKSLREPGRQNVFELARSGFCLCPGRNAGGNKKGLVMNKSWRSSHQWAVSTKLQSCHGEKSPTQIRRRLSLLFSSVFAFPTRALLECSRSTTWFSCSWMQPHTKFQLFCGGEIDPNWEYITSVNTTWLM